MAIDTSGFRLPTLPLKEPIASALLRLKALRARLPRSRGLPSIGWRIFLYNLAGALLLIGAIIYLSRYHVWLIDAKRESLRVQGEIIAAAIAANAGVETDRIVLDPDRLTDGEEVRVTARRGDIASLELPIRPERVTPFLKRLVQPTQTRARVYSRDGTHVADSAALFSRGQITRHDIAPIGPEPSYLEALWNRFLTRVGGTRLPLYKEIGSANGRAYPEVRAALNGITTPILVVNDKGQQIVSVAVPIQRMKAVQGVLLLSSRPGEIDELLREERRAILTVTILALLASLVSTVMLARGIARPMRRLAAAAHDVRQDISTGKDLPTFPNRRDEVGQLAEALRDMTGALLKRLEAKERFAADVAHELKNPVTAASSTAEALSYARTEEDRQELIQNMQRDMRRLNKLISDISDDARLDVELMLKSAKPFDLVAVLTSMETIFRDTLSSDSRKVGLEVADVPLGSDAYTINGHEGPLGQVLVNLIENAVSFSPEGGRVVVRARPVGHEVEVSVEDEGPGIPEDKLEQIFERFYTDRPDTEAQKGKNSGLGLSIAREIINAHNGRIWAENRPAPPAPPASGVRASRVERTSGGARFVFRLPSGRITTLRGMTAGGRRG